MPKGARVALVASLCLSLAPFGASATTWNVTDPTDQTGSHTCPGSSCNLRTAWAQAKLGDTILLSVDPVMDAALTQPPGGDMSPNANGTVTITAPKSGRVVRGQTSRFLAVQAWPWGPAAGFCSLVVENVEFNGFSPSSVSGSVFCIANSLSSSYFSCNSNPEDSPSPSSAAGPQMAGFHAVAPSPVLRDSDTNFGNWSQFRKQPLLKFNNVVFRNNSLVDSIWRHGGIINVGSLVDHTVTPVVVENSRFVENSVSGMSPNGMAIGVDGDGLGSASPVLVHNCHFSGNIQDTNHNSGTIDGLDGPIIGGSGPISISGSTFVGNSLGASRAVVAAATDEELQFHVLVKETTISNNVANQVAADKNGVGTLLGAWIVTSDLTLTTPVGVPPIAAWSYNDLYFINGALRSETRKPMEMRAYQVYNKNPVYNNLVNGTDWSGQGVGVANCVEAKPFVPCRKGTVCQDVTNPKGDLVVGYKCS